MSIVHSKLLLSCCILHHPVDGILKNQDIFVEVVEVVEVDEVGRTGR